MDKGMKLSDIAKISSGYLFRTRVDHDPEGEYQVIQIRDVSSDDTIDWASLNRVELKSPKQDVIVGKGDVLFRARGSNHRVAIIDQDADKTIATSQFHIIRVQDKGAVLPAYIAWYVNQSKAQQFLSQMSVGSSIKQIHRKSLNDLPVIIPDMHTQETIVQLDFLCKKEKQLMLQIQKKHQKLAEAVMLNKINNY